MPSRASLVMLAILSVTLSMTSSERLPGLKIRMSKKGLDYANSLALKAMSKELGDLKIPDQHGRSKNLEWSLTGITDRGVTIPNSKMNFDPASNGLTWEISGLGIKLHSSNWRIKYKKGWFKVSTSGSVDLDINRASLRVTVSLGESNGRPTVSMSRCHSSIGSVSVDFHGGTAFILNLFRGIIGRKIKTLMEKEICQVARRIINNDVNEELAGLKVHVNLGPKFVLDYSLVSPPSVDTTGLELKEKGEIYWRSSIKEAPLRPKPTTDLDEDNHMMYVWLTDYVANSAIYQASANGFLQYTVTSGDFPATKHSFMDTDCELFCVGNLVPLLGMAFPNTSVEASVKAVGVPTVSMTRDGISLDGSARVGLDVVTAHGKIHNVISFVVELYLTVTGSVRYERLQGEIIDHRLEITDIRSESGEVQADDLNAMLKVALDLGIVPELNAVMKQGIDLPVTDIFSFSNTKLMLQEGSILIATDAIALLSRPTKGEIQRQLQEEKEKQQELMLEQQKQEKKKLKEVQETTTPTTPQAVKQTSEQHVPTTQSQTTEQPEIENESTNEQQKVTDQPREELQTEPTGSTNETPIIHEEIHRTEQAIEEDGLEPHEEIVHGKPTDKNAFCEHVINFCYSSVKYCN